MDGGGGWVSGVCVWMGGGVVHCPPGAFVSDTVPLMRVNEDKLV